MTDRGAQDEAHRRAVEIRSHALKPGRRDAFRQLMTHAQSLPLPREWRIDVLAHEPCAATHPAAT